MFTKNKYLEVSTLGIKKKKKMKWNSFYYHDGSTILLYIEIFQLERSRCTISEYFQLFSNCYYKT